MSLLRKKTLGRNQTKNLSTIMEILERKTVFVELTRQKISQPRNKDKRRKSCGMRN